MTAPPQLEQCFLFFAAIDQGPGRLFAVQIQLFGL